MRISPFYKGLAGALASMAALTAVFTAIAVWREFPYGSPELLRDLAQIGTGLLIAYSVAIAAGGATLRQRLSHGEHQDWLGFVTGTAVCGLFGVAFALATAQHRLAGHHNLLDYIGLWWPICSVGMLGILVASLPYLNHVWRTPASNSALADRQP